MKSKRKTLSLCITKDGKVVVHAPTRAKSEDIERFVIEKQSWLTSKLAIIESNRSVYDDVIRYKKLLFLGARYTPQRGEGAKIHFNDDFCIIIPNKIGDDKITKTIKSWYKKQAKEIINKRVDEISNKIKLFASEIKFSDSSGRWGACNSKNVVSFNWRVIMLPPSIIDYVIIHELCHLVEFNHSKKFWSLVCAFLTDAKHRREKIKEYSFLLGLFKNC